MGVLHNYRQRHVADRLVAMAFLAGGIVLSTGVPAFATGSITVSQSTGLKQAQVVTVTGSGLAASSFGYLIECNGAPGEPTVTVGPPFDVVLPIGCSAPNLKRIVHTTAQGSLSSTIKLHESRMLGPPCGLPQVLGPCRHPDSAGNGPRGDAQNYPCPPSPAQQAAGVKCAVVFVDSAGQRASTEITFVGTGPPGKTTPGSPPTTPTTPGSPGSPGSTPTTTQAVPTSVTQPPTQPGTGSSSGTPSGADRPAGSGGSSTATAPGTVRASSGSLAFTGLGKPGILLAVFGIVLVLIGLALFFLDLRKLALWLLGL